MHPSIAGLSVFPFLVCWFEDLKSSIYFCSSCGLSSPIFFLLGPSFTPFWPRAYEIDLSLGRFSHPCIVFPPLSPVFLLLSLLSFVAIEPLRSPFSPTPPARARVCVTVSDKKALFPLGCFSLPSVCVCVSPSLCLSLFFLVGGCGIMACGLWLWGWVPASCRTGLAWRIAIPTYSVW